MSLFPYMLGLGVVTSVHCVSMCGPLVLTYIVSQDKGGSLLRRLFPQVAYQGSKLVSYGTIGLIVGAVGAAFSLTGIEGWISVAAAAFMILLGLSMTGWVPWLRRFTPRPPRFLIDALSRLRKRARGEADDGHVHLVTPVALGLLTGLLPCGPLYGAIAIAAAAGSAFDGSVAMVGFGLGTIPLLLAFGTVFGLLGATIKKRFMTAAAILVIGMGFYMLDRGAMRLGWPLNHEVIRVALVGTPEADTGGYTTAADGFVEVPLTIERTHFVPNVLSIPADKPVRLIVDRREDNRCSDELAVPNLRVLKDLKPNGVTNVELPPAVGGNYTLTCGMGMMAGTIQAVAPGGAAGGGGGPSPLTIAGVAVLLGVAGWAVRRGQLSGAVLRPAAAGVAVETGVPGADVTEEIEMEIEAEIEAETEAETEATVPTTFLGFRRYELILVAAAIAAAVALGLWLGGTVLSKSAAGTQQRTPAARTGVLG